MVTTYYDGEGGTYEDWEYLYTECVGESGGGGEVEEDPDIELQTNEGFTSYYEDGHEADMASSPNSIAPLGKAGPVGIRFEAEVWRRYNRVNSRITAIYPQQPAIFFGQVSNLYYNEFLQKNVIRKATLYNIHSWVTYLGVAAKVEWSFDIIYKYHQSPYIAEVYTRYTQNGHIQAISQWDIGFISWEY